MPRPRVGRRGGDAGRLRSSHTCKDERVVERLGVDRNLGAVDRALRGCIVTMWCVRYIRRVHRWRLDLDSFAPEGASTAVEQARQDANTPQMRSAARARRSIVTLLARFPETAAWGWERRARTGVVHPWRHPQDCSDGAAVSSPDHELTALMSAIDQLPDQYQRAALIIARWSGARRERDTPPRRSTAWTPTRTGIRGWGSRSGRATPNAWSRCTPGAADALRQLIDVAQGQESRGRLDLWVGGPSEHVFCVRGKLLAKGAPLPTSPSRPPAPRPGSSTPGATHDHRAPVPHTVGTHLAEGGAQIQTIMAVLGHRTPQMSLIYASLWDPA